MDRLELRTKFASRIEPFRLEEFGVSVFLRRLSGLARAKLQFISQDLNGKGTNNPQEILDFQCKVIAEGLVDEAGTRLYGDDELAAIATEIPGVAIDPIATKILKISSPEVAANVEQLTKNSEAIPSADSPTA